MQHFLRRLFGQSAPQSAPQPIPLVEQLAAAVNASDPERVAELLASGANPSETGAHGWTAVQRAAANGRTAVLAQLLVAGADLHCRTADSQQTLLHLAASGLCAWVFEPLVAAGLAVDELDSLGQSALFYSARLDDVAGVTALLVLGTDVNLRNHAGQTATDAALAREQDPVMSWSTAAARSVLAAAGS